ncbi:MAG: Lrp/AsnC family transcriptional regulator [Promethearchaeota archaeon]
MIAREEIKRLFELNRTRIIDETDFYIICLLEHEGEKSLKEISESLKENGVELTPAAVSMRLKRLKEKGILVKMVPLNRLYKLGFARDLILMIQVEPGVDYSEITQKISSTEGVKKLYKLIGEHDLLVELCCLGDEGLERSLDAINKIPGISRISKTVIQQRLKENYQDLIENNKTDL